MERVIAEYLLMFLEFGAYEAMDILADSLQRLGFIQLDQAEADIDPNDLVL